ncbi:type II toxin-antitoxin system HicB family antitoxin [Lentilactobacillus otakiensis]|uniref:Toxin-antitoxin system, antitoxin component, HicB family n=1 Tax=Lentilactobacillus otakiensis DSM 19908 = JCM 15040 TaxID=1423780 RepID=S4ND50_9LACO|nr:type II toxin-antitoxin system HicB family antitoxin [Lentilactobacillus otakiensis]MBZ3776770.1 type II toxin-antitoxin system HicB family antitoxin [Lentilactobacillus otakiensis]MDV3519301.1 type II toxin-antitoxin system HicB family antitoxin [Lentilactobacillus otakiensis]GAD16789.1 toxin-antitoxin system, antitoxin component, HicB family [Lentilactobacillus otakiensis DSM 19908 = JCM 15040]
MKYLYFALFTKNSDDQVEVNFPDFDPHVVTFGDNMSDALHMAHDALEGYLLTVQDYHDALPTLSDPQNIPHSQNQLVIPIEVDTTIAREREENASVKKTLTIPKYLNDLGNQHHINFSATLTDALKERLGVS